MELRTDVSDVGERQDVSVAEVDGIPCRAGKQGSQLRVAKAGAVIGMRDIDQVMIGLAEIGNRDVTGVEHEFVRAAQSGQDVMRVAVAKPAIEGVGIIVSGEIVAELGAEQVIDIRERVCTRPAGILSSGNVETHGYS